jgi:hypothetical protein
MGSRLPCLPTNRGQFNERQLPSDLSGVKAILQPIWIRTDFGSRRGTRRRAVVRLADRDEGQRWDTTGCFFDDVALYSHRDFSPRTRPRQQRANDLLLTFSNSPAGKNAPGAFIWVSDNEGKFRPLRNNNPPPGINDARWVGSDSVFSAADINADGRLDLLGLTEDGQPVQAINHGTKTITGR